MQHASIVLENLANIPSLPRGSHIALLQKCCVSFASQGFDSGFFLAVECDGLNGMPHKAEDFFRVLWNEKVDEALKAAHADLYESVEDSAKAIGMLLISTLTPYKTGRQALRGTHFDYYLVDSAAESDLPFPAQSTVGVEFTGILNGLGEIKRRMEEKRKRLHKNRDFTIYIVCVEHNFPLACIEVVRP